MNEINNFLDYIKLDLNYSDETIKSYGHDIVSFEKYLEKVGESLTTVTPEIIRGYLSKEISEGKTNVTCCRRIAALRHFYDYLFRKTPKICIFAKSYPRVVCLYVVDI